MCSLWRKKFRRALPDPRLADGPALRRENRGRFPDCRGTVDFRQRQLNLIAKGERFAVVDNYGLVWILTPEEVDMSRAFNPKAFESRAFSVQYFKEAPKIPPLPGPPPEVTG